MRSTRKQRGERRDESRPSPWDLLDPPQSAELPTGSVGSALSARSSLLEDISAAGARGDLSPDQQVAFAQAALEVANRATSLYLDALMTVRQTYLEDDFSTEELSDRWATADVASTCGHSEYVTAGNLDTAVIMYDQLPSVREAFACGLLDLSKVKLFAQAVLCLDHEQSRQVELLVLPEAPGLPYARLREALDNAVAVVTGKQSEKRAAEARAERSVVFRQLSETMAEMVALLPAEDAAVLQNALHHLADASATPEDARTAHQRRADTLVEVVVGAVTRDHEPPGEPAAGHEEAQSHGTPTNDGATNDGATNDGATNDGATNDGATNDGATNDGATNDGATNDGATNDGATNDGATTRDGQGDRAERRAGRSGRKRPLHALVTIPLSTLLGMSDDPGHLAGHGPLPAQVVRDLFQHATWQCAIVDDEHGTLVGLGRRTYVSGYTPGKPLADHVLSRDLTCRFPGCGRQATSCEIDHLVPYPRGSTCSCNTGPLCKHHHRLKHEAGWTVERSEDPDHPPGSLLWISPTGGRHVWRAPSLTPAPRYARELARLEADRAASAARAAARADPDSDVPPF